MAETVEDEIENALNLLVITTEQCSNMRKTLKEKVYETVSKLRHLFSEIKINSESKRSEIKDLTNKVNKLENELQRFREKQDKTQQSPSIDNTAELNDRRPRLLVPKSSGLTPKLTGEGAQGVALPNGNMNRLYASVVREPKPKRYKMTVKARSDIPSEEIKQLLKTKVTPGEIKVGVNSLKSLHDGVLIETNCIEEI
jgi:DNA repair exonuclease SbcCD ATPase subunit